MASFREYPAGVRGGGQIVNINSGYNCIITALEAYSILEGNDDPNRNLTRDVKRRINLKLFTIKHTPDIPVNSDTFKTLEKDNNLNIYVYKLSEVVTGKGQKKHWTVHRARKGGNKSCPRLVSLLLITDDHVALIKDLPTFVDTFHHLKSGMHDRAAGMCYNCLTLFKTPAISDAHTQRCSTRTTVLYPEPGQFKQFTKVKPLNKSSHIAFLDFEAYNRQPEEEDENPRIVSKQKAYAYCYVIIDGRSGEYCVHRVGVGEQCVDDFLNKIARDWARLCERKINVKQVERPLPVLVHNLSYDAALILKEAFAKHNFEILKHDGGTFYALKMGNIRLMDSLNKIRGSLSSLASSHIKKKGSLEITRRMLSKYPDECTELVLSTGKQYYPYDYITGFNVLRKTGLPLKVHFNSSLTGENIPDKGYEHVCKVWKAAKCTNLLDYTILYLVMDVGLLTVVTTNETSLLRNVSKHTYKSFERLEEYRYIVNHCKETVNQS
ncbi:uncharacterized protein [Macrobrachium rosenbergii]|uniref:uncharacterized protein n=1 Tax=Macrobrachium rosenbergii TaxID=79674 RepID=UPI0034D4F060